MTTPGRRPEAVGSGRYSRVAIVLHWTIAAAIVLQVVLANRMEGPRSPETFAVTQLHKSVGITILLLSLARLAWRLINPPPPMPATLPRWEKALAGVTHVGFYVIMIGLPLTGWIMVSSSTYNRPIILYGLVHWPYVPGLAELAPAAKKTWHDLAEGGHGLLAKATYVLLALHVAGALKHQLFSRDEPVLARMAPGARTGRWLEPRLLAIVLGLLAVIVGGFLLKPPPPGMKPPPAAVTPLSPAQEPIEAQGPQEPASADTAPAASTPPAAPANAPVRWIVDRGSTLTFETSWSGQALSGRFDRWSADILFSPGALDDSRVTVSIDLASVNTGDPQRDATLPTADWFDAKAHPKATFTADRFEAAGPDRFVAHGQLDLRGKTRPLELPFSLHVTGDKAEARGVTTLDRTRFGVGQGEWTQTDQIPAKVTVRVNLRAHRA